jgi:biotin-dependent carboxylase-like uncharacterized protein
MDSPVLETLNAMLGNPPGAAGLEWALSAGEILFEEGHAFAFGGAECEVTLDGRKIDPWIAHHGGKGQRMIAGAPSAARFAYFAFAGGVDCPPILGSLSTYLPAAFGGLDGRRLAAGDLIPIGSPAARRAHAGDQLPEKLRPARARDAIRFIQRATAPHLSGEWTISAASDRTGYRLESGASLEGGSIVSEPVSPGTIQIPPGGSPIVLMADAPTIGGYAIGGAVISADIGYLAQRLPGERIELVPVSIESAERAAAELAERLEDVVAWSLR